MMNWRAFTVSTLLLLVDLPAHPEGLGTRDALDEVAFADLQISAVIIDMHKYLGWYPDDKEAMKEAAERAHGDLERIKDYLEDIVAPDGLGNLKGRALEIVDTLETVYDGIERKSSEEVERSFKGLSELYAQFYREFTEALNVHKQQAKLSEKFDTTAEEVRLIEDEEDRDIYRNAVALMKEDKYKKAYDDLSALAGKYIGTPFADCVTLRMSDCLLMADTDLKAGEGAEDPDAEGASLLSQIVESGRYSPVLCEAFLKWRTMTQLSSYGMSNMSEIPNREYNERRWRVVRTIRRHSRNNPDDAWARKQADELLLGLPNIQRGGLMGNDNLMYWARIYADTGKEE